MSSFKVSDFSFPAATGTGRDPSNPGFIIKGHKLRWLSPHVQSRRGGRIWKTLKISGLPKEVKDKVQSSNPNWLDGDTIRRRDLILAYAPLDQVKEQERENRLNQRDNEVAISKRGNLGIEGAKVEEAGMEKISLQEKDESGSSKFK